MHNASVILPAVYIAYVEGKHGEGEGIYFKWYVHYRTLFSSRRELKL